MRLILLCVVFCGGCHLHNAEVNDVSGHSVSEGGSREKTEQPIAKPTEKGRESSESVPLVNPNGQHDELPKHEAGPGKGDFVNESTQDVGVEGAKEVVRQRYNSKRHANVRLTAEKVEQGYEVFVQWDIRLPDGQIGQAAGTHATVYLSPSGKVIKVEPGI